jgi:NAD(P)-dependent dehydrogenase (short-subunit alcohol dehydrogenase family)
MNRLATLAAAGVGAYYLYRALRPGYDFRGKNVLITGGSRGLGLVLGRQLTRAGANLAICARDPDELGRAFEQLTTTGARVVAAECDITDPARVREFVAVARQRLGPIDVLINNAGVIGVGPLETQRVEDFELAMKTHFWATLYFCLEVIPEMKARQTGRIVNITSFGGRVAVPHLIPYCASKFAQVGLSDGLRAELARFGVTVTTVCPGLMRTGSHLQAEFKGRHEEEYSWFALGAGMPGLSINAERAARQILRGVALGDAEVVVTLPAKLAIIARALFPNLVQCVSAAVNRFALPEAGGVGPLRVKGYASRGKLPEALTTLNDAAAPENNELPATPPPVPSGIH